MKFTDKLYRISLLFLLFWSMMSFFYSLISIGIWYAVSVLLNPVFIFITIWYLKETWED